MEGSFLSSSKVVEISIVAVEASPAVKAACLARQEANLTLLSKEVIEEIVGISLILVPSGKRVDEELYQWFNLSLTS